MVFLFVIWGQPCGATSIFDGFISTKEIANFTWKTMGCQVNLSVPKKGRGPWGILWPTTVNTSGSKVRISFSDHFPDQYQYWVLQCTGEKSELSPFSFSEDDKVGRAADKRTFSPLLDWKMLLLKVLSIWIVMLILCPVHSHYNQLAEPPKSLPLSLFFHPSILTFHILLFHSNIKFSFSCFLFWISEVWHF